MPLFIALIRGINVGNNLLKMERLREVWSDLGISTLPPRTYLQSGNVIFEAAPPAPDATWESRIAESLSQETRLPVKVLVRSAAEWKKIATHNPFLKEKQIDLTRLYVTFLATEPPKSAAKTLAAAMTREKRSAHERLILKNREIYAHCPNGYGTTVFSNNWIEKILQLPATTRNWNTVTNLFNMLQQDTLQPPADLNSPRLFR